MDKIWIGILISLIILIICWLGYKTSIFEMIQFMIPIYSAILFACFLFTVAVKQIKKNISPYCVFAIVNVVIGIGISIFSIYDLKIHSDEWLGGLVGAVLLVYVIPFIMLLLIIDFIVWKISKSKK